MFYGITAALTYFTLVYTCNLAISCTIGAWKMRESAGQDWHSMLEELQSKSPCDTDVMHIVILPNYQEDEQMLLHTLENLGRSPLARQCMRVMLGMEQREGPGGRRKAERLIAMASHLFADIAASYHPANLPGELPGKSSNTQWAYKEVLRRHSAHFAAMDASRVFLTVGDADTLWHPQFFSALSYQALGMSARERAWSIWQPPVLLLRNLFSVPGPTRVSGYATVLFELAGLANQRLSTHFCYSAYSLSLALASHDLVNGWDRDVIAEDHHMFCKCYFAALKETLESTTAGRAVEPTKVQLRPVYLPALSYLVESDKGWLDSCYARFQQARRHSQGVSELSYVLLQYAHLFMSFGVAQLPWRIHTGILGIVGKMLSVHIINSMQGMAVLVASAVLVMEALSWAWAGGLRILVEHAATFGPLAAMGGQSGGLLGWWGLAVIFGPLPPLGILMTATTFIVVRDTLEGRLTQEVRPREDRKLEKVGQGCAIPRLADCPAPGIQGSSASAAGQGPCSLGLFKSVALFLQIQFDYFSMAETTLFVYGILPVALASWSLMCHGTRFDYIVAAKPS